MRFIIELRKELENAFRAAVRRFKDEGLDSEEARERAEVFVLGALNKVAHDLDPDPEKDSLGALWNYLMRQRPMVLWALLGVLVALIGGAYWLGHSLGSLAK